MAGIVADGRFALRVLWRHRTFSLAVVLTLGIGFGGLSGVFSVYRAALVRPLDLPRAARLVFLYRFEVERRYYSSASYGAFTDYRARAADLVDFAAYRGGSMPLEHNGRQRVPVAMVSEGYFAIAGVAPLRGRVFGPRDGTNAAVIGERLWETEFGRDEAIVGRALNLSGRPTTIVGVLPASFAGLDRDGRADVWVPLETADAFAEAVEQRGRDWLEVVGRLRDGVSREQAQAALGAIGASLGLEHPETDANWRIELSPGAQGNIYPHVREEMTDVLSMLGAGAALLLLVTCGTAANLTVARIQARGRELRIRTAVGAERRHLARLLALEHVLLALGAAMCGSLIAGWLPALFASYALPGSLRMTDLPIRFDATQAYLSIALVIAIAGGLTLFTAPSWWRIRRATSEGGRVTDRLVIRRTLVGAQIAMSLALLFSGGLLFKALRSQLNLDPGFRSQPVLMAEVNLPPAARVPPEVARKIFHAIAERVASMPGVQSAAWTFTVPYGARRMRISMTPQATSGATPPESFDANVVDAGYFQTLGVPILRGRAFTDGDRDGAERVVIITESLAQRYWPWRDAIGRHIAGRDGVWTIIGIVPDDLHYDIRTLRASGRQYIYLPLAQVYEKSMSLLVSSRGNPLALAEPVRRIITEEAADAPEITTSRRHVDAALSQEWLAAGLAGTIAAVALLLAALGLYGILRYTVAQRTREIGVRVALGAPPRAVVRLALADTTWTLAPGLLVGLGAALLLARTIRPLLHEVRPFDPSVLALSIVATAAGALVAAWLPARAAVRIDPAEALRTE
jgi:putative ABC transport system permease protein